MSGLSSPDTPADDAAFAATSFGRVDPDAETDAGVPRAPEFETDEAVRQAVKASLFGGSNIAPTIGRYSILKVLGEGGMGLVYAAYDDLLDRRVAVKLIKGTVSSSARKRMLREAQAMAKLSHPNVVPVFEVGEHEGQLFLAMEYVKGQTLREWQDEEKRGWRDVLVKYLDAGRGLIAAHATGLVHRDFKPHNVIVGEDDRVRVLDFGLAAKQGEVDTTGSHSTVLPAPKDAVLDTPLTASGAVMGTPAYMPPEQFMSGTVDHRSDQFSFCVSLWEGLYGARPFEGNDLTQLFTRIAKGDVVEPKRSDVPVRLRRALERGLRSDPEERWPELDVLLRELEKPDLAARRWRTALLVGTIAIPLGIGGWFVTERVRASEARAEEEAARAAESEVAARRAEHQKLLAEVRQRNALLTAVARGSKDATETAALLREVVTRSSSQVFGWDDEFHELDDSALNLLDVGYWSMPVTAVAFSPDGTHAALGFMGGMTRVWDLASGEVTESPLYEFSIASIAINPDGTMVAAAGADGSVHVWRVGGADEPTKLQGHDRGVTDVAFSPDGSRILSASYDKTARLWRAEDGAELGVFGEHEGPVRQVEFSADGSRVLTASSDQHTRIWEVEHQELIAKLGGTAKQADVAAFTPDGAAL